MHNSNKVKKATEAALQAIQQILSDKNDEFLYDEVLAQLMLYKDYSDRVTFGNLTMEHAISHYTAKRVGDIVEGLVDLHQFFVEAGASSSNPHDFGYADRYGAAYANEENFKSMALQTQNYTYMIVLIKQSWYPGGCETTTWNVHIRYATNARYSENWARPDFPELEFLSDRVKSGGKIYDKNADDYFSYHDGRDRGYLCSVKHDLLQDEWQTEDAINHYSMLSGVFFDVTSHISMIGEYREELRCEADAKREAMIVDKKHDTKTFDIDPTTTRISGSGLIKIGAGIMQDFHFGKWPNCLPPGGGSEANDPYMVFDVEWDGHHWDCRADGYGMLKSRGDEGEYGNGSIFVSDFDGVVVLTGAAEKRQC